MIKIALTGPECSGKTTLAIELGRRLDVNFIPEFARHYLNTLNRPYNKADLDVIAKKQQQGISLIGRTASKYMVVDTEMLVLKIWSQEKYREVSPYIQMLYAEQDFDLLVLCKPDIPYEDDLQRENPHDRDRLFDIYLAELQKSGKKFITVEGSFKDRVDKIIASI
jgi:nicotinamide riboside kinase